MAPLTRRQKKALAATPPPPPVINSADRISRLHQDIQAHILSFLPAHEAVQTCVLARTWRDVWKSSRRLVITWANPWYWYEVREFVDGLFRVRGDASLHAVEFRFDGTNADEDDDYYVFDSDESSSVNRWIQWVLKCKIQMLRVDIYNFDSWFLMGSETLVSSHLTRLELTGVWFYHLNMDGCPQLEHLVINQCSLEDVTNIMSLSLKNLAITSCETEGDCERIRICVPHLNSLLLDDMDFKTPLLEKMPELMGATVHIDYPRHDSCDCGDPMTCDHVMQADDTSDEEGSQGHARQNTTKCMVLEGLAQAKDLVLIAHPSTYTIMRDLRWCPTFSKLKTLVINGDYWCQPDDCSALGCILAHAPVLEKLTLISYKPLRSGGKYKVEMKGHPDATVNSTKISQHLEVVEINCEDVVNERFVNVLNFLGTLNICFGIRVTKMIKQ